MRKRIRPSMPVDIVAENPRAMTLNAAGYGMLCRLLHHFWLTDCHPLPESDNQLYQIARAHKPTWYSHRDTIKAILAELTPILARTYERRNDMVDNLARLRARSASVTRGNTLARKAGDAGAASIVVQPKRQENNQAQRVAESKMIGDDTGWVD